MIKKKLILIGIMGSLALNLMACGKEKEISDTMSDDQILTTTEMTTEQMTDVVDIPANTEVQANATFLEDAQLSNYADKAETVGDVNKQDAPHTLVEVNMPVSDFKIWMLNADISDDGMEIIKEDYVLYELAEVTPEKAVIFTEDLGEILPFIGFSFVASDGVTHHYYVTMSGMDGSAILTEYTVAN